MALVPTGHQPGEKICSGRAQWEHMWEMHLVCLTCMETFGNGVQIGSRTTHINRKTGLIQLGLLWALPAWCVAGAGTATPVIAGRRTGTGTIRTTGTSTWAFAWPAVLSTSKASFTP